MMRSRKAGEMIEVGYQDEDVDVNWPRSAIGREAMAHYRPIFGPKFLVSHRLRWLDARRHHLRLWETSHEEEIRAYTIPLLEAFQGAARSYPQISVDPDLMAGAPCVQGTRIPVYMILDAIEYHGSVEGAINSYPRLTLDQVREAIGFAKLVVECPIEHENTVTD